MEKTMKKQNKPRRTIQKEMKTKDSYKKEHYKEQYQFRERWIYVQILKPSSALTKIDLNLLPIKKDQAFILFKKKVLTNCYKL